MLNLLQVDASDPSLGKWRGRQEAAIREATKILGPDFRRHLYFGGQKPRDGGASAKALLDPAIEIVYIRDFAAKFVDALGHQEGSEPLVRVINMLKAYGMVATDPNAE